jgi:hypothetical protein
MKKLSFYSFIALLLGVMFFTACENSFNEVPEVKASILPDELTVEIPSAFSADLSLFKSTRVDTLKGREIYGHLRFYSTQMTFSFQRSLSDSREVSWVIPSIYPPPDPLSFR